MDFKHLKFIFLLFAFTFATSVFADKLPKLVFESTRIEVGEVKRGDTISFDIPFTNEGEGKLVINRVKTGCSCTKAKFSRDFYRKGEKGVIHVTFDSGNILPAERTKTITVLSNSEDAKQTVEFHVTIVK